MPTQREIARQLKRVRLELDQLQEMVPDPDLSAQGVSAEQISAILRARRHREIVFGDGLFSDPAWDLLLALYESKLASQETTIADICRAASVNGTTALRWITTLEGAELVTRTRDSSDRRQVFLSLSEHGATLMKRYLAKAQQTGFPV